MNGESSIPGSGGGQGQAAAARSAPLRLLVIDDEPGVLRALTLVLQTMNVSVEPCGHPQDALDKLAGGLAVDGILSDLRMPKFTGIQVLDAVRTMGLGIPFVLMSGHATAEDVAEARRLGVTSFLAKPFMPPQLAAEVTRIRESIEANALGQLRSNG